jgi:WD domain, G-beta repeat
VREVAIVPDGSWLASGGDDGSVRIWDAGTGAVRATLTGHTDRVREVAIAPDGSWLASASNDRVGADPGCGHPDGARHPAGERRADRVRHGTEQRSRRIRRKKASTTFTFVRRQDQTGHRQRHPTDDQAPLPPVKSTTTSPYRSHPPPRPPASLWSPPPRLRGRTPPAVALRRRRSTLLGTNRATAALPGKSEQVRPRVLHGL